MRFKKKNYMLFAGVAVLVSILLWIVQQPVIAGYQSMPITSNRNIEVRMRGTDNSDAGNQYSGVYHYSICTEKCTNDTTCDNSCANSSNWSSWSQLKDKNGNYLQPTPTADAYTTYTLPDKEGALNVCVKFKDAAINGEGTGNISDYSCNKIFYDKSAPVISDVVLNDGNEFINDGNIPVKFTITDNRAGIKSITYNNGYGNSTSELPLDSTRLKCEQSIHAVNGDGTWSCTYEGILETNVDKPYIDLVFTVQDKVGNTATYDGYREYYDKNAPEIDVLAHTDSNGSTTSERVNVDVHVKDPATEPWIYPSGLTKVTISNSDGSNLQELKLDATDGSQKVLDKFIQDYALSACSLTGTNITIKAYDKAGNIAEKQNNLDIYCHKLQVTNVTVTNVVNPQLYTFGTPFDPVSYYPTGYMEPMPQALAGGNMSFNIHYKWEGNEDVKIDGTYTIIVENNGYKKTLSGTISWSTKENPEYGDFISKEYPEFISAHTITLPNDAPSKSIYNENTKVWIHVVATATVKEGGVETQSTSTIQGTATHPDSIHIADIVGNIDDFLYFGELN